MFLCLLLSTHLDTITLPVITVYPEDQVEMLARLIYSEAGNQSYDGMLAVGNVVSNRMEYFEKPIEEIIFKPRQFDGVKTRHFKQPIDSTCYLAAKEILSGITVLPPSILYYANAKIAADRKWIRQVKRFKAYTIQDHDFYYDPTARLYYQIINQYKSKSGR